MLNGRVEILKITKLNMKPKKLILKDNELLFAVREPFQSIRTQTGIATGIIKNQSHLIIESLMPTSGVIFSDGIETDFLRFNSGSVATVGISEETAELVTK